MNPETRMFLINKFLAEVVKPISRIEAARRAKNIASGSGGRLGLGDARKPKLTGMGSGLKDSRWIWGEVEKQEHYRSPIPRVD